MLLPFDLEISLLIESLRQPLLDFVFSILSLSGNPLFWVAVAVVLYWQKKGKYALHLINLVLASAAITFLLKHFFALGRPAIYGVSQIVYFTFDTFMYDIYTFPSGHTILASAAFAFFFHKMDAKSKLVSSLVLFLVGFSRIYLGFHFLSDVLAGIAIGFVVGYIASHLRTIESYIQNRLVFVTALFILFAILSYALIFLQIQAYYNFIAFFILFYIGYILVRYLGPSYSINSPAVISVTLMLCYVLIFYFMNQNTIVSNSVFGGIGLFIAVFPLIIGKLFGWKPIEDSKTSFIDN